MEPIDEEMYGLLLLGLITHMLRLQAQNRIVWFRVGKNGRALTGGQRDLEALYRLLRSRRFQGRASLQIHRDGTGSVEWSL